MVRYLKSIRKKQNKSAVSGCWKRIESIERVVAAEEEGRREGGREGGSRGRVWMPDTPPGGADGVGLGESVRWPISGVAHPNPDNQSGHQTVESRSNYNRIIIKLQFNYNQITMKL